MRFHCSSTGRRRSGKASSSVLYTPEGSSEAVATQKSLEKEDKLLAAKELLERQRWKGDPVADLGVCRP